MAEFMVLVICAVVAFALATRQAPLWAYAGLTVAATIAWQSGLIHGAFDWPDMTAWNILGALPALALVVFAIPAVRSTILVRSSSRCTTSASWAVDRRVSPRPSTQRPRA